jgi:signal transduction histidine kinase/CheY-like chemotaxis protein/AraC-like DNA-binding protein
MKGIRSKIDLIPGMSKNEPMLLLTYNWVILLCCFLTCYFANPEKWSIWIFVIMTLPVVLSYATVIRGHWRELAIQFGISVSIMVAFFTGWAPPMIVLLFVATGILSMVFLLRPWGGFYFVGMAMLVTVPIAISMMGFGENELHSYYSRMAILFATALMIGVNGFTIAKQNKWTRNQTLRAQNLLKRMQEVHYQFTKVISLAPNLTDALWEVADLCIPALELQDCVIYLLDPQTKKLEQIAAYGPKSLSRREILSPLKIDLGKGVVGRVAETGEPLVVNDTSTYENYIVDDSKRLSELAVPIIFEGTVFGVIDSEHEAKDFFTEDHLALFQMIATLCANKIAELRLVESEVEKAKTEKELQQINALEQLRNTFLNNLSHDLRTPLSLIRGPLQELGKNPNPEVQKLADIAMRNAKRLNEMVSGLLDMHSIERGALKPLLSNVDIESKLREWFTLFVHEAEKRQINYVLKIDSPANAYTDEHKLSQIVQNLLSNSFKFTPDGGTIELIAEAKNNILVITVEDSGPGIIASERVKVFERFYKIDHDSHLSGTGLGLAMVKEFSELLGGKAEIKDSKLSGACFVVKIPIDTVAAELPMPEIELKYQLDKSEIVVIEDHPEMNTFIAELLRDEYIVHTALNAEDGWEIISRVVPDLIITDLMLPGMSGEMLCKRIKTTVATDHIPVLALSAKQSSDSKIALYKYGADNYLTKPFDSDELRSVVASLIDQRVKLRSKFSGSLNKMHDSGEGIRKIDQLILQNITDADFGPPQLGSLIGLGRNQLQRKIKSITGFTPVEYIRIVRLENAKRLLQQGNVNVSEAAFSSGFNQLPYFSKSYKARFGVSPSEDAVKAE